MTIKHTSAPGLISDPAEALAFMLGGNATFTLVSRVTSARRTYRVRTKQDLVTPYFVSSLIGPDNEADYMHIGCISKRPNARLFAGTKGRPNDISFSALAWFLPALHAGHMPSTVEFWHEGRCARCARKLTDPESIARGFGPECAKRN